MKLSIIVILTSLLISGHEEIRVNCKYLVLGGELNSEIISFLEQEKSMPYFSDDFFITASFTSRKDGMILLHIEGGIQKNSDLYIENLFGVTNNHGHWIYVYKDTCQISGELVQETDSVIYETIHQYHGEDSISSKIISLEIIEDDTFNYWDYLVYGDSLKKI